MAIKEILSRLTVEEKARLLTGYDGMSALRLPDKGFYGVQMADGPYGVKTKNGSTCYPNTCLMACGWDREIAREIGVMMGEDCVREGVELILAPAINVKRTPLGGRNFEYYSEDPVLTGELAAEYAKGVNSRGVATCAKHFACNGQENGRWTYDSVVDEDALRNVYLKAFEIMIKKGNVNSVMAAYNRLNGEYCCQNERLLKDILRDEWGYEGVVTSDWCAAVDLVASYKNGMDLEMPANAPVTVPTVVEAVKNGELTEQEIDEKIKRLVALYNFVKQPKQVRNADNSNRIRQLTAECMVLLKNDGALPLKASERILVVGKGAVNPKIQGGGCAKLKTNVEQIPLEEIRKYADAVTFSVDGKGIDATAFDKIVAFLTLPEDSDSEAGDRTEFEFPSEQVQGLLELAKANPNVIAVLQNGSAVDMSFAPFVKGVLETYYAGSYGGGAVADVLFGKISPSGRLAESIPMKYSDAPVKNQDGSGEIVYRESQFVGYRYYTSYGVKPRFAFGYGLSYADIRIENVNVERTGEYSFAVRCALTNYSELDGKGNVQVYLQTDSVYSPVLSLLQFSVARVKAKQSVEVVIELDENDFSYYAGGKKRLINGEYAIVVAKSSEDVIAAKKFTFTPRREKRFSAQTQLKDLLCDGYYREITLEYMTGAILDWAYGDNPDKKCVADLENDCFLKNSVYNMPIRSFIYCHKGGFTPQRQTELLLKLNEMLDVRRK